MNGKSVEMVFDMNVLLHNGTVLQPIIHKKGYKVVVVYWIFLCFFLLLSLFSIFNHVYRNETEKKCMKEKIQSTSLHSMALVHSTTLVTITTTQKPICNKLWFSYWKRYTKCAYRLKKYQPYSAHKVHMLSVKWPKSWAVNWYKSYKTSSKVK